MENKSKSERKRCEVCGRYSTSCYEKLDTFGRREYCVCSRCLIERGDAVAVKLARADIRRR